MTRIRASDQHQPHMVLQIRGKEWHSMVQDHGRGLTRRYADHAKRIRVSEHLGEGGILNCFSKLASLAKPPSLRREAGDCERDRSRRLRVPLQGGRSGERGDADRGRGAGSQLLGGILPLPTACGFRHRSGEVEVRANGNPFRRRTEFIPFRLFSVPFERDMRSSGRNGPFYFRGATHANK